MLLKNEGLRNKLDCFISIPLRVRMILPSTFLPLFHPLHFPSLRSLSSRFPCFSRSSFFSAYLILFSQPRWRSLSSLCKLLARPTVQHIPVLQLLLLVSFALLYWPALASLTLAVNPHPRQTRLAADGRSERPLRSSPSSACEHYRQWHWLVAGRRPRIRAPNHRKWGRHMDTSTITMTTTRPIAAFATAGTVWRVCLNWGLVEAQAAVPLLSKRWLPKLLATRSKDEAREGNSIW